MIGKNEIKYKLYFLACGALCVGIGLLYPSFYWLVHGCIISFFVIISLLVVCFKKDPLSDNDSNIGCIAIVVVILFSLFAVANNNTRYITPHGHKQHIYKDCSTLFRSVDIKEVSELEGYFHWCFMDCKTCLNRRDEERKEKKERLMQIEREEKIEELQQKIDALRNGADVEDIEDYEEEDAVDELDAPPAGVPSRYW